MSIIFKHHLTIGEQMKNPVAIPQEYLEKLFHKNPEQFYSVITKWNMQKVKYALQVKKFYHMSKSAAVDETGKIILTWDVLGNILKFRLFKNGQFIAPWIYTKEKLLYDFKNCKEEILDSEKYNPGDDNFPFKRVYSNEELFELFRDNESDKQPPQQSCHRKHGKIHRKNSKENGYRRNNISCRH